MPPTDLAVPPATQPSELRCALPSCHSVRRDLLVQLRQVRRQVAGEPCQRGSHQRKLDEAGVRARLEDGGSVPPFVNDEVAGFIDAEYFKEPDATRDLPGFGIVNEFLQILSWPAVPPQTLKPPGIGVMATPSEDSFDHSRLRSLAHYREALPGSGGAPSPVGPYRR